MFQKLLNRLRTLREPVEAPEDAPESPISEPPLPDDIRQAMMQLRGEWADMQLHWSEVLDKLQAWAQRQSARDRKHANRSLDRLSQEEEAPAAPSPDIAPQSPVDVKAELRRRVAAMRGR